MIEQYVAIYLLIDFTQVLDSSPGAIYFDSCRGISNQGQCNFDRN